uniref:Inner membrane protein n=1 Tax=Steinernema glaseri TaxID=37863 RepID=A0A1I7YZL3_9BILA
MFLIIIDTVFGVNFGKLSTALMAMVEWIPACDAAITLCCVKPYRRGIQTILRRVFRVSRYSGEDNPWRKNSVSAVVSQQGGEENSAVKLFTARSFHTVNR